MSGQLINVDAWITWLEALRQVAIVAVPIAIALAAVYVIAGGLFRLRR